MENIIFLDIDGVINDNKSRFSSQSLEVLKQLINIYDAKMVIISSWQQNGTTSKRNHIRLQFEKFGIYNIDFIEPNFEGNLCDIKLPPRLLGIVDYLKNNASVHYVILDDDYHNDYKLICLNHYRTKKFKGLMDKDLSKITFKPVNLNNFQYISYKYRQLGEYEQITNKLIKVFKNKVKNY